MDRYIDELKNETRCSGSRAWKKEICLRGTAWLGGFHVFTMGYCDSIMSGRDHGGWEGTMRKERMLGRRSDRVFLGGRGMVVVKDGKMDGWMDGWMMD